MKVVIMAGGKGTRIASIANDVPKPMIPIGGKPILEYQIENLRRYGLTDIILVVGHLGEKIQHYFEDGSRFGVRISYFVEDHPLGTAGALFQMPQLSDDFLLMCGDVILDVDFSRFIQFHRDHHAWASLMAHPNGHPYDSSLLVTETLPPCCEGALPTDSHRVIGWLNKEDPRTYYKNRVNAGIEIISPELLAHTHRSFVPRHPDQPDKIDLDRDVLKTNISSGRIFAYDTPEYIKDMGTPDRYHEVTSDLEKGKVRARNLSQKQRAIFLDRDGTINVYKGFLSRQQDMELIPGASSAVRLINQSGFLAVVVSNQPVIARGEATFEELQAIHEKMETLLGRDGAFLDALYYCPHHPDKGFPNERPAYKKTCTCRKPQPGLLLQAAEEWNIDLSSSFLVGDSDRDVEAGRQAHLAGSFKIPTNEENALTRCVESILASDAVSSF